MHSSSIIVPAGLQLISLDLFITLLAFPNYSTELSNNSSTAVPLWYFHLWDREAVAMEIVVKVNQQTDLSSSNIAGVY